MNVNLENKTFYTQSSVDCDRLNVTPDLYKHESENKFKVNSPIKLDNDMIKCVDLSNISDKFAINTNINNHTTNTFSHKQTNSVNNNMSIYSPDNEEVQRVNYYHHYHPHLSSSLHQPAHYSHYMVINSDAKSSDLVASTSAPQQLLASCQTFTKMMESQSCISSSSSSHVSCEKKEITTSFGKRRKENEKDRQEEEKEDGEEDNNNILQTTSASIGLTNSAMSCKHGNKLMCNYDHVKCDINNDIINSNMMMVISDNLNDYNNSASFNDTFWQRFGRFLSEKNRSKYKSKNNSHKKVNNPTYHFFLWTKHGHHLLIGKIIMLLLIIVLISAIIITVIGSLNSFLNHDNQLVDSNNFASLMNSNLYSQIIVKHGHHQNDLNNFNDPKISPLNGEDFWWWPEVAIYELFPASFKDSNNDGYGDLNGIKSKLRYLKDLGIQVVRLNSVYTSPNYPYDFEHIINYTQIDPHIGSVNDFTELVNSIHSLNMKIIVDINLCCTSRQHLWALKWFESHPYNDQINQSTDYQNYADNLYKHFYASQLNLMQTTSPNASKINHQSKGDTNTDLSSSSSSFQSIISNNSINKKQLNQLLSLNWSNSQVQLEMSQIIDFWCKQSIDGFYLHNIHHIYLDKQHSPITLLDIIRDLRQFIDEHCSSKIIIAAERASLDLVNQQLLSNRKIKQYKTSLVKVPKKTSLHSRKHIYSYFQLIVDILPVIKNDAEKVRDKVNDFFFIHATSFNTATFSVSNSDLNIPQLMTPSVVWCLGDFKSSRLASRIGKNYMSAAIFLLIMLPGSVNLLYGDEIALQDSTDPSSGKPIINGQLAPLSWTSELFAGFTSDLVNGTQPWLTMNMDYINNNIQENHDFIPKLRELFSYRKLNRSTSGSSSAKTNNPKVKANYLFHYVDNHLIVLERYFNHKMTSSSANNNNNYQRRLVLFANFGDVQRVKDFSDKFYFGSIKLATNSHRVHEFLYLKSLLLDPGEAIIAEIE